MTFARFPARLALAACLAVVTAGCQDLADQLTSDFVSMAVLLKTPDAQVPAPTETDPEATRLEPGKTELQVYFGRLDKKRITDSVTRQKAEDGAFVGLTGAIVQLDYAGCRACPITLADDGEGHYTAGQDTALEYTEAKYTLTIRYSGSTFKLEVDAPAPLVIDEFREAYLKTVWEHEAGKPFTMTRYEETAPAERPIALATATPLEDSLEKPWVRPTTDALDLLNLLLDDREYRAKTITVPGDVFKADSSYLLTLAAAARGAQPTDAATSALFGASSFIAGVADAGVVTTRPKPTLP